MWPVMTSLKVQSNKLNSAPPKRYSVLVTQSCTTLCDPMDCSLPSPSQGIFLTPGSDLNLLHCRQSLHHLRHQGSSPKDISKSKPLVFVNVTLCGNSFLADIIKDVEIILVSEWASIPVMGVLKRDRTGDDTMMRVI